MTDHVVPAIKYYQQAVAEDPQDPSPHSNLSAVYYEIGEHDECVKEVYQTLDLSGADREGIYSKLAARLAKSHLQLMDIEKAKEVLSTVSSLPGLERLRNACGEDIPVSFFDSDEKQTPAQGPLRATSLPTNHSSRHRILRRWS